jgi:hypothetical protein
VIYHGLRFAFSEWSAIPEEVAGRGASAVRDYAAGLSKRFGYEIGLSDIAVQRAAAPIRSRSG